MHEDSSEGGRQRSLPCEHLDDETAEFASVPRRQELGLARLHIQRNPSPDTFHLSREDTESIQCLTPVDRCLSG